MCDLWLSHEHKYGFLIYLTEAWKAFAFHDIHLPIIHVCSINIDVRLMLNIKFKLKLYAVELSIDVRHLNQIAKRIHSLYLPLNIDFTETKFKHINRCRFKFWLSSSYHPSSVSVSANGLLINWKGTARILFWERIEFCITLFQLIIQLYWIPSYSLILNMMECLEINEIGYKWGSNDSWL